jgi:cupin fold WbuC family metalloprotein
MIAHATAPDVYISQDAIVSVGPPSVQFLTERVRASERKRVRLCAHKTVEDRLQEMVIAFSRGSYVRPSRHIGKEESIHIIEGLADFVFLDSSGAITAVIPLGPYGSGRAFYCRTPEGVYHTVLIRSDAFVVQETTQGPFKRSDTEFAPWAPADSQTEAVGPYLERLANEARQFLERTTGAR